VSRKGLLVKPDCLHFLSKGALNGTKGQARLDLQFPGLHPTRLPYVLLRSCFIDQELEVPRLRTGQHYGDSPSIFSNAGIAL
jgi:hypothetical protein